MPRAREIQRWSTRVLAHRPLSPTAYELRLRRDGLRFQAGQLLCIHGDDLLDERTYTIASGENDDELRVLYRLIPEGRLTPKLAALQPGDELDISGPYGEFTVRDPARPLVFIATGTGIAPCRAFLRSHAGIRLTVLHGARTAADLFYRDELAAATAYHPCLSAESAPDCFAGRVTSCASGLAFPENAHFYLCGANEMFYEIRDILAARGIALANVFTEAYYYRIED